MVLDFIGDHAHFLLVSASSRTYRLAYARVRGEILYHVDILGTYWADIAREEFEARQLHTLLAHIDLDHDGTSDSS